VRVKWFFVVICAPIFGYGLLNLASPRMTVAWQIRVTSRRDQRDPRRMIGESFQRWLGVHPATVPDEGVLRRVRLLGLAEMTCAVAVAAVFIYVVHW